MANDLQIYLLDPQKYSPETIAVAFAKTSRSPESFAHIAEELNDAKSAEFNEKWVVGYGHSSVAEHAVLHIAVENISRLAVECLESNRLASYTEKSTRYQTWDADAFYVPQELTDPTLKQEYMETCRALLNAYLKFIPLVSKALKLQIAPTRDEAEGTYERRIRAITVDSCRFLLPAAVLANVGMTINARALEHAITKMLSHPLEEVRRVGQNIKARATEQVPTLLKYADLDEYLSCSDGKFIISHPELRQRERWCRLVQYDAKAEDHILAACLYRNNHLSYEQALEWLKNANDKEKSQLAQDLLECKDRHSTPLRELEHVNFTFELKVDQGAYYEIKRHRMMTLTTQPLTTDLGYAIPQAIESAGLTDEYCACMKAAKICYEHLHARYKDAASYVVPNGYNRDSLITSNLRSLLHFIKLRSAPNAHFSVRRAAQEICAMLRQSLPLFSPHLLPAMDESVQDIDKKYFYETDRR